MAHLFDSNLEMERSPPKKRNDVPPVYLRWFVGLLEDATLLRQVSTSSTKGVSQSETTRPRASAFQYPTDYEVSSTRS